MESQSPKGTPRGAHTKSDIESCIQTLKQADDDISVQFIRDCLHLGKFNPSETSRSLLVKLCHIFHVDTIFYNRPKIPDGMLNLT